LIPYFPEYNLRQSVDGWVCDTLVRKKHSNGLWYDVHVKHIGVTEIASIAGMIKNAYKAQLFHRFTLRMKRLDGTPLYIPCQDQRDEKERLKQG